MFLVRFQDIPFFLIHSIKTKLIVILEVYINNNVPVMKICLKGPKEPGRTRASNPRTGGANPGRSPHQRGIQLGQARLR